MQLFVKKVKKLRKRQINWRRYFLPKLQKWLKIRTFKVEKK